MPLLLGWFTRLYLRHGLASYLPVVMIAYCLTFGSAQVTTSTTPAKPQTASAPITDITLQSPGERFTFVSYGDIRFMDVSDTRHSNPVARVALVEKIAKEKPVFVTISGDLVYRGADALEWLQYDRETKVWRDQKIALLPALGDHDVHGGEAAALANFFRRFPLLDSKRPVRPSICSAAVIRCGNWRRQWQR